jgi:hypothetical protein
MLWPSRHLRRAQESAPPALGDDDRLLPEPRLIAEIVDLTPASAHLADEILLEFLMPLALRGVPEAPAQQLIRARL